MFIEKKISDSLVRWEGTFERIVVIKFKEEGRKNLTRYKIAYVHVLSDEQIDTESTWLRNQLRHIWV